MVLLFFKVTSFSAKGVLAAYISGEQEDKNVKKSVVDGAYQIVVFTPETLLLNKQWPEVTW